MEKVKVNLNEYSYDILIAHNLTDELYKLIEHNSEKNFIITEKNLYNIYSHKIDILSDYEKIIINQGERSKSLDMAEKILEEIIKKGGNRKSKILALGGGVIGDIAGFCASIYMRGIPFIQIPTTLLAQVDSSVGGKTGVNFKNYKNIIGTFYQPAMVIIDTNFLKSLHYNELLSGIGEIVKYGIVYDYDFFKYIIKNIEKIKSCDENIMPCIIKHSVEIKSLIVSKDEKESSLRKILNFGHTIAHALESITNFSKYRHGEAVIVGMYYETLMSRNMNLIEDDYADEILEFLTALKVDLSLDNYKKEELISLMIKDKKNSNNKISFILPVGKGEVKEILLDKSEIKW